MLVSGSYDKTIKVWDIVTHQEITTLENTYTLKINALNLQIKALTLKIETKNYD